MFFTIKQKLLEEQLNQLQQKNFVNFLTNNVSVLIKNNIFETRVKVLIIIDIVIAI